MGSLGAGKGPVNTAFDSASEDINGFGNSFGRRRALSEFMAFPSSCYDVNEALCEDFSTDAMPDTTTFDADVAFELADYYCCALRKDDPKELYKVAVNAREFCESASYLEWQASPYAELYTPPQRAIAQYCPNYITPEDFFNPTWANLWNVVILGHQSSAFLKCDEPSESSGRVTVTINGLEEDNWPHVWITLENDWTFGWSTAHPLTDASSYDTVTGVEGRFEEGPKSDFDIPLDAPTWTVTGINIEKMMEEKNSISSEPYDLIQNNCAHVALKLLSAGLGCESIIVPFFSPASMINVLNNVVSRCNV